MVFCSDVFKSFKTGADAVYRVQIHYSLDFASGGSLVEKGLAQVLQTEANRDDYPVAALKFLF